MNILLIGLLVAILAVPLWALFSSGTEKEKSASSAVPDEAERTFRRRSADKELEHQFPDEEKERRGRDDRRRISGSSDEMLPVEEDFKLPYTPQDVLPDNSSFEVYRRTLKNADVYMQKGDFATAQSIYEGVLDRVSDTQIRDRLEENLSYMNNYQQILTKRKEVKKQQQSVSKPQEIRLTLEGADTLADRLQIGIAPEKPPLDVNEIVDRISEKLTGVAPDASRIAENSVQKYREELAQVKSQLQGMTAIREQLRKMNEERLTQDLSQVQILKNELSKLLKEKESDIETVVAAESAEISSSEPESMREERERSILREIKQREDENHLLRDRLEMMKDEISNIREENKKAGVLEKKLEESLASSVTAENDTKKDVEIDRLREELSDLRSELKQRNAAEAASIRELAESVKKTISSRQIPTEESSEKRDVKSIHDMAKSMKETLDAIAPSLASQKNDDSMKELAQSMKENLDALSPVMQHSAQNAQTGTEALESLTEAMKEGVESLAPILKDQAAKAEEALASKKLEDEKKDEFQLIDEMINGPKYDEPSDDDVMEKILNDAMKEQKKKDDAARKKKDDVKKDDGFVPVEDAMRAKEIKPAQPKQDDVKEDFELVSDYMRGDEDVIPTDDEVMEKILSDTMKGREFDRRGGRSETRGSGGDFPVPQKRKKELPILRVSYNFSRLPDEFTLSTDKNYLEFSFYKFKPLLEKAGDLVKRRKVKDAINYYKVVMDQDIPPEFKEMLGQNIHDLNEYLTKYYTSD